MVQAVQELDFLGSIGIEGVPASLVRDEPFSRSNCERFVAFYIGEKLFGVQADQVAEVIHPFRVTPLPGTMPNLIGVTAVRGEVVGVLDLRQAAGFQPAAPGTKEKLIVLNRSGVGTQLSFPADRMHEIVLLAPMDIAASREPLLDFVSGIAKFAAGDIRIIDVHRLPNLLGVH